MNAIFLEWDFGRGLGLRGLDCVYGLDRGMFFFSFFSLGGLFEIWVEEVVVEEEEDDDDDGVDDDGIPLLLLSSLVLRLTPLVKSKL